MMVQRVHCIHIGSIGSIWKWEREKERDKVKWSGICVRFDDNENGTDDDDDDENGAMFQMASLIMYPFMLLYVISCSSFILYKIYNNIFFGVFGFNVRCWWWDPLEYCWCIRHRLLDNGNNARVFFPCIFIFSS